MCSPIPTFVDVCSWEFHPQQKNKRPSCFHPDDESDSDAEEEQEKTVSTHFLRTHQRHFWVFNDSLMYLSTELCLPWTQTNPKVFCCHRLWSSVLGVARINNKNIFLPQWLEIWAHFKQAHSVPKQCLLLLWDFQGFSLHVKSMCISKIHCFPFAFRFPFDRRGEGQQQVARWMTKDERCWKGIRCPSA